MSCFVNRIGLLLLVMATGLGWPAELSADQAASREDGVDKQAEQPSTDDLCSPSFEKVVMCAERSSEDSAVVPVGVAKIYITPETPVCMYGYASRKMESEGVAGRLSAKALVIGSDQSDGPAVLLMVDIGALLPSTRNKLLARLNKVVSIRPERFVLCHTHCHSGPRVRGMNLLEGIQREHLDQYYRQLNDRLVRVVLEALKSRRDARLAWAQGSVGFAANRRVMKDGKWAGFGAVLDAPVDHTLPVLRVTDTEGKLMAVVANYACHCTTLRGNYKKIHGDWAACAQQAIEADHPGAIAITCIGCGADADPCPHGTVELCLQHGRALADEVKRVLAMPMTPISPRITAKLATLQFTYGKVPSVKDLEKNAKRSHAGQNVLRQIRQGKKLPKTLDYDIATWVFGDDLAMVFLTGEVVVDYSLRMKKEITGIPLWINAYSHDVVGYVVSKRIIREGGYEARNSLSARITYRHPNQVSPAIEDRIVAQVKKMLEK